MAWFTGKEPEIQRFLQDQQPAPAPVPEVSEKEFMWKVIGLARSLGWKEYHVFDSRKSRAGFPDLVLWRERVIFAELKTDTGRPTAAQEECLDQLQMSGAEVYLWQPSQMDQIVKALK